MRAFWRDEFAKYPDRYRVEALAPIQNKLSAMLTDPHVYRCFVDGPVPLGFRSLMDQGSVVIVNLAKGKLGTDSSNVLGSIFAATIGMAALSRAETPIEQRRPFAFYIDEFQSFTTLAFANLVPELRKMGCAVVAANQYLFQLPHDVRRSVLANAGTIISFRVGPDDAIVMARIFQPRFTVIDLLNLANRHFYLRLMIDGAPSVPFSGRLAGMAS